MREIKFRAYDKTAKQMYQVDRLGIGKQSFLQYAEGDKQPQTGKNKFYPSQVEIMQYTGLKDKNDVEIYEGDILRDYGNDIEDWVVSYEYGKFVGTFDNVCEDLYEIHDLEVIGNIYENSELLKEDGLIKIDK